MPGTPDIYVDTNATGQGNGTPDSPYRTIGQALRNAQPGDFIGVAPGDYNEEVVINNKEGLRLEAGWIYENGRWRNEWSGSHSTMLKKTGGGAAVRLRNAPKTIIQGFYMNKGLDARDSDGIQLVVIHEQNKKHPEFVDVKFQNVHLAKFQRTARLKSQTFLFSFLRLRRSVSVGFHDCPYFSYGDGRSLAAKTSSHLTGAITGVGMPYFQHAFFLLRCRRLFAPTGTERFVFEKAPLPQTSEVTTPFANSRVRQKAINYCSTFRNRNRNLVWV